MPRYVALLRGINLGKRRVKMEDLRRHVEALGYAEVSTFIASGNVLFTSGVRAAAKLESQFESHLARELGYEVETFVRSAAEVSAAANADPFPAVEMSSEINSINVIFFKSAPSRAAIRVLESVDNGYDLFRGIGRELYWLCRGKITDSQVWTQPEVRALKLDSSTMRNLNTVRKLAALLGGARAV